MCKPIDWGHQMSFPKPNTSGRDLGQNENLLIDPTRSSIESKESQMVANPTQSAMTNVGSNLLNELARRTQAKQNKYWTNLRPRNTNARISATISALNIWIHESETIMVASKLGGASPRFPSESYEDGQAATRESGADIINTQTAENNGPVSDTPPKHNDYEDPKINSYQEWSSWVKYKSPKIVEKNSEWKRIWFNRQPSSWWDFGGSFFSILPTRVWPLLFHLSFFHSLWMMIPSCLIYCSCFN